MGFFDFFKKREKNNTVSTKTERQPTATKPLNHTIDSAMEQFYANPCEENILVICDVLVGLVAQNTYRLSVPVESIVNPSFFDPLLSHNPTFGYVYQAFTTPTGNVPNACFARMPIRTLFEHIAKDSLAGVVLNPQNGRDWVVFLSREKICKVLYCAYCLNAINKKDALNEHCESSVAEKLQAEVGLVYQGLENAMKTFYTNPNADNLTEIYIKLITAVVFNIPLYILCNKTDDQEPLDQKDFAQDDFPPYGCAYMACTKAEEVANCGKRVGRLIPVRKLFDFVLNGPVDALALDPGNGHGSVAMLKKDTIRKILEHAHEKMESLPEEEKKVLLNKK